MPIIIPLLATGYLFTIYLLLMLAQWTLKSSRYMANSIGDVSAPTTVSENTVQQQEADRWSFHLRDTVLLTKGEMNRLKPELQRDSSIVGITSSQVES